jgi:hypothetical protein
MMVKSGLEFFILKFYKFFRVAAAQCNKKSAQKGWIGLAG